MPMLRCKCLALRVAAARGRTLKLLIRRPRAGRSRRAHPVFSTLTEAERLKHPLRALIFRSRLRNPAPRSSRRETHGFKIETRLVCTETPPPCTETRFVRTETRLARTETRSICTMFRPTKTETRPVWTETRPFKTETRLICTETRAVYTNSRAVCTESRVSRPAITLPQAKSPLPAFKL